MTARDPAAPLAPDPAQAPAIELQGIGKRFPGVRALEDVSFRIAPGSCHALCGENGAGKSTLGKLLAGIHRPDTGQIRVHGAPARFEGPRDALRAGIGMVHQELCFCDNLSVAENLCLGALPRRGLFVSRAEMARRARAQLEAVDPDLRLDVQRLVGELTVAEQQVLQIAVAVGGGARIIVFDEPTSSLSQHEADRLYALLARLRARGTTCIYVSHRMPEIFRLCDTITVLRDGRHVLTAPAAQLDEDGLVSAMIGRRLEQYLPPAVPRPPGEIVLRAQGLSHPPRFRDVGFQVAAGEVVGLAGLVGAGRSDVARAIFGLDPDVTGQVEVGGTRLPPGSPTAALRAGVGLVPEDRKRQGLVLDLSGLDNVTLPILPELSRWGWLRPAAARARAQEAFARLKVRVPDLAARAIGLSGGNQQKLVLAKWLASRCRVLILDEPTRGVDVGAKAEIHALIRELADSGTAIVLISSELPELLSLATRFLVLREGSLVGELPGGTDQATLLRLMAGVDGSAA